MSFLRPNGQLDQVVAFSIPLYIGTILFILLAEIGISKKAMRSLRVCLFILYTFLLLYETLLFRNPTPEPQANFSLFWSYKLALEGDKRMLSEILLNILLFVPFGFLLSDSHHLARKKWLILLLGICTSLAIETIQYVAHLGLFEFDDVLNNGIGCFLGLLLHKANTKIFRKK